MTATSPVGPQVRLRPFRVAGTGLTLEGLRERIAEHGVDVSMAHLSNVECGHQRPSERLLRAWALALGLDPLDVWMAPRVTTLQEVRDDDVKANVTGATPIAA